MIIKQNLRALLVEDSEDDALILLHTLEQAGYQVYSQRVQTELGLTSALSTESWDIILSDFSMPNFNGLQALKLVRDHDIEVPFVFVSGTIGEELAVSTIKRGANDYILKDNLVRLVPTIKRLLEDLRIKRESKAMKQALEESRLRFQHAFRYSGSGIALVDLQGNFLEINAAFCSLLGYEQSSLLQMAIWDIIEDECADRLKNMVCLLLGESKKNSQAELRLVHQKKYKLWVILTISLVTQGEKAASSYFIIQFQDRTERRFFEEQLLHLKTYNALTELPNRQAITSLIDELIIKKNENFFYVIVIDFDRFKLINEIYGTDFGDHFLRLISQQFKKTITVTEKIGYLDGGQFVVVSSDSNRKKCEYLIEEFNKILNRSQLSSENGISFTASIGISQFPLHADRAKSLIQCASIAMRHCKKLGGNKAAFFDSVLASEGNKLKMEGELRSAVANEELFVCYQPKFNSGSSSISGLEALVRWKRGSEVIPPDIFISIAEETGSIIDIGREVLIQSIAFFSILQKKNMINDGVRIAVNVSTKQLNNNYFPKMVSEICAENSIDPRYLELEITESTLIQNYEECLNALDELCKLGIKIAVDDFGTGYSSLNYLKNLQCHYLKIDKSFVQACANNSNSRSIITSIISLSHKLKLQVTAEGVETLDQYNFLTKHHCDEMQGYYFSKPLNQNDLLRYLVRKRSER